MRGHRQTQILVAAALSASSCLPLIAGDLAAIGKRFEAGDAIGARTSYLELLANEPTAAVHYNLGRVDQAMGAEPQAVLWYRRALAMAPEDPWARDNLDGLRGDLGVPPPNPEQPLAALFAARAWSGWVAGVGLISLLACRWLLGRPRGWGLLAAATALTCGHLAVQAGARLAPVEAVLMTACESDGTSLPAGSEIWVSRSQASRVWSAGSRFECDPKSVLRVDSDRLPPAPAPTRPPVGPAAEPGSGGTLGPDASGVDEPLR